MRDSSSLTVVRMTKWIVDFSFDTPSSDNVAEGVQKQQVGELLILSDNITVDPKVVCHAEHSEASLSNAILRSFTSVQDDK